MTTGKYLQSFNNSSVCSTNFFAWKKYLSKQ